MMPMPTAALPFLADDDLARLSACGAEIRARRGDVLLKAGEATTALLLVLEGEIAIERDGVTIAHCGPGEVLGEISMLEDAAASATARAEQDARVIRVPRVALEALLASHEQLAARFYRSLAVRLAGRARRLTAQLSRLNSALSRERHRHIGELAGAAVPMPLVDALAAVQTDAARLASELARLPAASRSGAAVAALCERVVGLADTYTGEARILEMGWADLMGFTDLNRLRVGVGNHIERASHSLFSTSATLARGSRRSSVGAADYETAQMIARPVPSGDGVLGPLVDAWFLERPLCKLRRAAARDIHAWLVAEAKPAPLRACAVGGGTFAEALDAVEDAPPGHLYATCIDLDPERIRRARAEALDGGLGDRTSFLCADVIELARGGPESGLAPQDRIYSLELLETLEDADVVTVLDWAHAHLVPGGSARFLSVAPELGDLRWLTYVMGWPLRARSAAELGALAARSRFATAGQVTPLGDRAGLLLSIERA
jgi:CRP-like cAMP-binding protein